jgi:hypothetical protein
MSRLVERAPDWLGRRWVPWATIFVALLLVSPCLEVDLALDDYILLAQLDPSVEIPGVAHDPLDLFSFISGQADQRAALMEAGFLPWWAAPDLRASFWRPLSSLTHLLDFRAWPRSALLGHAHSMLWFAALLAVLFALYRRFHVPWVAHLALLLYAVDDARGMVVGWTANRNALVAATFAFAALLAHDRARRDAWWPGAVLAPVLFAAALMGGEAALALTAYLLAHALFIDRGSLARRLARLWPYALLTVAWLAAYTALGHGTRGGGLYVDPTEGLPYLRALVERLPVLLAAQLGSIPSDVWPGMPRAGQMVVYALALATLAVVGVVLLPVLRRRPVCRFWTLGAVLSLPPVCATFPADRLLVFAGVGAMGAIAMLMAEALDPDTPPVRWSGVRVAGRIVLPLLVVIHLVIAPILLPLRALTMTLSNRFIDRVDASIPSGEDIREKTLVVLNAPLDFLLLWYVPAKRAISNVPRPRAIRLLVSGIAAVHVYRLDNRSLRLRPADGLLVNEAQRMVRGASRPFHPGDEVALSDLDVEVDEVSTDGRPLRADFTFDVPLDDPSLVWMQWQGSALAAYSPPAVGDGHVLPAIDTMAVMTGHAGE